MPWPTRLFLIVGADGVRRSGCAARPLVTVNIVNIRGRMANAALRIGRHRPAGKRRSKAPRPSLQLLNSGAVSLSSIDRDEDIYGRKLRNVAVDGLDVGDTLISEALVRAYGEGRRSWCG